VSRLVLVVFWVVGRYTGGIEQKQLFFILSKFEANPFDKGLAQGAFPGSHAAEICLGIASYFMEPGPRIFNE